MIASRGLAACSSQSVTLQRIARSSAAVAAPWRLPCGGVSRSSGRRRRSRGLLDVTAAAAAAGAGDAEHASLQRSSNDWDPADLLQLLQARRADAAAPPNNKPGRVYLVGTGPGDPGLLTLRAVQLLQAADVVLYDRLVSDDVLRLVGGGARMVYVGKTAGFHTRPQEEIHSLLGAFAEAGATVLRLKGGDPYIFGRGGEEVAYLRARGIEAHAVPGITAAAGIAAELGIPLTHRGLAASVRYLTGHARDGGQGDLDGTVAAAADPHTTLVVYMGLATLPRLVERLVGGGGGDGGSSSGAKGGKGKQQQVQGLPRDTPAVAVERGTTLEQRAVFAPLHMLGGRIAAAGLKSPTLLVIGKVVALAPGWAAAEAAGFSSSDDNVSASGSDGFGGELPARLVLPDCVDAVLQQQRYQQQQEQREQEEEQEERAAVAC